MKLFFHIIIYETINLHSHLRFGVQFTIYYRASWVNLIGHLRNLLSRSACARL